MSYTITLADGRKLTGLSKNGDNFVSAEQVDESIFEDNLSTMTVSDGETKVQYHDVEFIQQQEWVDGSWYLAFREITESEKREKAINEKLQAAFIVAIRYRPPHRGERTLPLHEFKELLQEYLDEITTRWGWPRLKVERVGHLVFKEIPYWGVLLVWT